MLRTYTAKDIGRFAGSDVAAGWLRSRHAPITFDEAVGAVLVARIVLVTGVPTRKVFRLLREAMDRTGKPLDKLIFTPGSIYIEDGEHPLELGRAGQKAMSSTVAHEGKRIQAAATTLQADIERRRGQTMRLKLADGVFLDRGRGRVVTSSGIPVESLAQEATAGGGVKRAAEVFAVPIGEAQAAVEFIARAA